MAKRPWNWNDKALVRFIAAARVGDLHTILDVPADGDLRTALHGEDARKHKHGWERLLALHVAQDYFGQELDGIIYDYAEFRFFRNDDDGYMQQRLAVDLGVLHCVDNFGLHDGQLAYGYWQAALEGPYPEGVQEEFAKIEPLLKERTRALLVPLMTP
ncbi:hypothetical protein Val02_78180 [Virgisporangium aliadipatigenens]|uniref:Uncharacterized protein n=1 Tax=Virgisporangium aliadipatigenens TaxID=741659 RepID=A0A8J3YUV7_9ACTN|nr:hypothetical protein [Virgisporangium aliadipatigenens]GIJ50932.1 hypothetical protein Val02_78180 [Virgisporangium aliadipatigenens]